MLASVDSPILVADVGGTNLNLALLAQDGSRFRLLRKARFSTQGEQSLLDPIQRFLAEEPLLRPGMACLAGAGPVLDRRIHLTNAPWDIDGVALERELGIPVHLVNDFIALSCGVLQLDLADPNQVTALPHGDTASIKDLLVRQIIAPVRWFQSVEMEITRQVVRSISGPRTMPWRVSVHWSMPAPVQVAMAVPLSLALRKTLNWQAANFVPMA